MTLFSKLKALTTKEIGDQYETLALAHLENAGYALLHQNYRCKRGEIDLIMHKDSEIIFVEVKYRKSAHFGNAAEMVTASKQQKLSVTAQHFLTKYNYHNVPCRFDVIAFSSNNVEHNGAPALNWIKNAF